MTSHPPRRRQLAPGATVLAPRLLGPTRRAVNPRFGQLQLCVCGLRFQSYKTHRQTAHHKGHVAADRAAARTLHKPAATAQPGRATSVQPDKQAA